MAAPVSAPAAAPAAAPIEAPRTRPVAAPPMIAPVTAPHAAPWPTEVSQEVRKRQVSEMPETIMRVFVLIKLVLPNELINRPRAELLRSKSAQSALATCYPVWISSDLRPYKNFVNLDINDQSAVCDFRAVVLLMRRIRADNKSRLLMRISLGGRVPAARRRIFFFSVCFRDRRCFDHGMALTYARVDALRVQSCAEHKKGNRDCRDDFQRFRFHRFVLRKISQPATQTDVCGGKFKKDLRSCVAIRAAFSSLLS